ncbi:MAG: PorV/PorQ family protein, partial [Flavobacteriales bacterium]
MLIRNIAMSLGALFIAQGLSAQISNPVADRANDIQLNTITTAVPFLLIAPDSRSGAIGDAGVALSPDAASIHWNPAKMSFADKEFEVGLSYSPWLRTLVDDMNLAYLSGYRKLNKNQAVGAALRYFSLGEIT